MSDDKASRPPGAQERRPRGVRGTIGAHLVALVAIQLVLVLGLIGFAAVEDFRSSRHEAELEVSRTVDLATDYVADVLEESATSIDLIPQFADLLASPAVCQFTQESGEEGWDDEGLQSQFLLLRPDGSPMCPPAEGEEPQSYASADWFQRAIASAEPIEAGPMVDASGKHVIVYASYAKEQATVVGIIADLSAIGEKLDEKFGTGAAAPSFLVTTADRSVLISSSNGHRSRSLDGTPFSRPFERAGQVLDDLGGVERIYAEGTLPDSGWHLYAGVSTSDALAGARNALRERTVVALVVIALMMAAAIVIQRRFVRPIRALARVTERFSEGDLAAKVEPSGPVELARLGRGFNAMGEVRAQSEAALGKAYKAERRAAEELREIDAMRNAFLMAISHELRTPLTSVVGYSSLLKDSYAEMEEQDVLTSISAMAKQSKRLERLLVDLLDVERLSRGAVQPNLKDTEVRNVVRNTVANMNVGSRVMVDVKSPAHACVDVALVERILENLVSNAIKHTPLESRIWVRAARQNGELRLIVEDDGPGVPDDLKQKIFEPFKQGDVPEHSPGTGVGLTLVAQFAKLHGGRAWVEDRRGGGASFRVVLPAKPRKGSRVTARASTQSNGLAPAA